MAGYDLHANAPGAGLPAAVAATLPGTEYAGRRIFGPGARRVLGAFYDRLCDDGSGDAARWREEALDFMDHFVQGGPSEAAAGYKVVLWAFDWLLWLITMPRPVFGRFSRLHPAAQDAVIGRLQESPAYLPRVLMKMVSSIVFTGFFSRMEIERSMGYDTDERVRNAWLVPRSAEPRRLNIAPPGAAR